MAYITNTAEFEFQPADEVLGTHKGALQAINRLPQLDRRRVRAGFERRFTARRMAEDYVQHYQMLVARSPKQAPGAVAEAQERDQPPREAQRDTVNHADG